MANRLAGAMSPYLRQHADNPVDWWPWCTEAFAEARRLDRPILLSVGYAACHWCHVMAHESFSDPAIAAVLNDRFVSIKVDREERPDIDAVYLAATQALTGGGGWPMTVFLDHAGRPFYAGTYFPPSPQPGMPSFAEILHAVDRAWQGDRARVAQAAQQITAALRGTRPPARSSAPPTPADVRAAVDQLAAEFDPEQGGFGSAPKFPPALVLEFLLRADALARAAGEPDERPLAMVAGTLRAMAGGGIYDQLAGGFARYSVDAGWVVPHFEKMLYDNALLLRTYVHWGRATSDPLARRVVRETAEFLLAEVRTAEGAFAASLDADSDGREGAFYVWTPSQLVAALGPVDGGWVAGLCAVTSAGTFEPGWSVLQLPAELPDEARWARCREALCLARAHRRRPARDDKVVAAWNGLAIAALAEAGALLGESAWVGAAVACAEFVVGRHWSGDTGQLARVSLAGEVSQQAPGVLEDYADVAAGLLALYQVTGDERWFATARALLDAVVDRFGDGHGGFFETADDAPQLLTRSQDPTDGVTPSGWSAAVEGLLTLAALTGDERYQAAAETGLAHLLPGARHTPRFSGWAWAGIVAWLAGPVQVAVVLPSDYPPGPGPMQLTALNTPTAGTVIGLRREGVGSDVALLAGRPTLGGLPTAYPCRGFVCDLPMTNPADLAAWLRRSPMRDQDHAGGTSGGRG